ncbi:hypothetical protein S83_058476 [Arachis hypogaea]
MVGGLKSTFLLNALFSTILISWFDLTTMEWEETGRIPPEIFRCFRESIKFKIFGGGDRVSFLANRIGKKLVLWDRSRSSGDVVGDGDGESDGGSWR